MSAAANPSITREYAARTASSESGMVSRTPRIPPTVSNARSSDHHSGGPSGTRRNAHRSGRPRPHPIGYLSTVLACIVLVACGGGDGATEAPAAQPALTIITPQATDASTTRGSIDITGELREAPPGTIVTVDGDEVEVDSTGGFSDRVGVEEGATTILVEAVLPDGGVLSEEVIVTRTLTGEQQARRDAREAQREQDLAEPEPPAPEATDDCDPNYSGCVPVFPPDVNCPDVAGPVDVVGDDPHGLDRDGDGVACE